MSKRSADWPDWIRAVYEHLNFEPCILPSDYDDLRHEVRDFVRQWVMTMDPVERARSWAGSDAGFSQELGKRGWIGMGLPTEFGGHGRSLLERYIVCEELLSAGAPVGAHWIADRQSSSLILRYGSECQKRELLPAIVSGELYFCIGMSEPDAGSDLASIKTRAEKVDGGWLLSGQKVWTTNAHISQRMIALVRTAKGSLRHEGLSQFLIDLASPGISIVPIEDLVGGKHFNEVFFDEVYLPDEALIGRAGDGWQQVTSELTLERSGPERYLSSFYLLERLVDFVSPSPAEPLLGLIGKLASTAWTLRQMSLSIAFQLQQGREPALEAAVVKDLGNDFEQQVPKLIQSMISTDVDFGSPRSFGDVLAFLLQTSPSFSLRGGTREILRGIIARGLGLR